MQEETVKVKKQWYVMDYLKFFFCFCIIGIHVELFKAYEEVYFWIEKGVFRVGVPFFMITSGFLLGSKISSLKNTFDTKMVKPIIKSYSRRLIKMLMVFEPISLVLNWIIWGIHGKGLLYIGLRSIRSIVCYPLGALWYIQAMLVGAWISYYFLVKKRYTIGLVCGIILYIVAMCCNSYYFLVEDTVLQDAVDLYLSCCQSARNGLFYGYFMLLLGIGCYRLYKEKLMRMRRNIAIIYTGVLTAVFYILYIIELYLLKNKTMADDGALFIMLPLLACALVLFSSIFTTEKKNSVLCRNLSTGMYLLHRPLIYIYTIISLLLHFSLKEEIVFIIIAVLSFVICIFLYERNSKVANYLK